MTILLKLSGPLQAWGTDSYFEIRHTDSYPSKSAIVGLLSASLGYRRNDDDKIRKLNELLFAVRIDQEGLISRDYQIAAKYKDSGKLDRNYVTNRYYLSDAVFVVAISHADDKFMNSVLEALKNPYFQLFLGRRSFPINYDYIIDSGAFKSTETPLEILKKLPWQASDFYKKNIEYYEKNHEGYKEKLQIYADKVLISNAIKNMRKDNVISFSQKERKFTYRIEGKTEVSVDMLKEE